MLNEWIPLTESRRLPAMAGIYAIRHIESGREYVGQSKNIRGRAASHRAARSWHYFGRALRCHGLAAFEVCVLAVGEVGQLGRLEQEFIVARGTMVPGGFNLAAGGDGPTGVAWSDERKAAQVAARTGGRHTPEAIEKMRQAALENNGFRGKKHTAEAKAKMGAAAVALHTGRKRSAETRANISAVKKGKPAPVLSPEARARQAAAQRGQKRPGAAQRGEQNPMYGVRGGQHPTAKRVAVWAVGGLLPYRVFDSGAEAAYWANASRGAISSWCSGARRQPAGWLWTYT